MIERVTEKIKSVLTEKQKMRIKIGNWVDKCVQIR